MSFKAQEDWEINNKNKSKHNKKIKKYSMLKHDIKDYIFVVDLYQIKKNGKIKGETFIAKDVSKTMDLIKKESVVGRKIAILNPRYGNKDNEYIITDVMKIYEGMDKNSQKFHYFKCENNEEYIDPISKVSEEELETLELIYLQ